MSLKFGGWPRWTTGHIFYTMSSFVHHFKSTGEFKLEFQSRNAVFGSKSSIFRRLLPRHMTEDQKNKGVPLLCHFKPCGAFCRNLFIEASYSPETLSLDQNNRLFGLCDLKKLQMTLKKIIWHLIYATLSFVGHSVAICELKWKLQTRNA